MSMSGISQQGGSSWELIEQQDKDIFSIVSPTLSIPEMIDIIVGAHNYKENQGMKIDKAIEYKRLDLIRTSPEEGVAEMLYREGYIVDKKVIKTIVKLSDKIISTLKETDLAKENVDILKAQQKEITDLFLEKRETALKGMCNDAIQELQSELEKQYEDEIVNRVINQLIYDSRREINKGTFKLTSEPKKKYLTLAKTLHEESLKNTELLKQRIESELLIPKFKTKEGKVTDEEWEEAPSLPTRKEEATNPAKEVKKEEEPKSTFATANRPTIKGRKQPTRAGMKKQRETAEQLQKTRQKQAEEGLETTKTQIAKAPETVAPVARVEPQRKATIRQGQFIPSADDLKKIQDKKKGSDKTTS